MSRTASRPAGAFLAWLGTFLDALRKGKGIEVDCAGCTGCCRARHFVLVEPREAGRIERARPGVLVPVPGRPDGARLIPFGKGGRCAFLAEDGCSIYALRPLVCRQFDCRVLPAAGLRADLPGQAPIAREARRWEFSLPTPLDGRASEAVRQAAAFVGSNAELFPGGRVPDRPEQLAVLAAKVHQVFLGARPRSAAGTARKVVEELRRFHGADSAA